MALVALVLGTATSVAATGRITVGLLASGTVCWSAVPLLQLCTGVLLVRGARLPPTSGLERYFQTHRPWSLWLLGFAGMVLLLPDPGRWLVPMASTFVVPLVLTFRRLAALCRVEFGFSAAVARRRTLVHQVVTVACLAAYGEYAGRLLPRFIDTVAR
jgi:hypothetical protein